MSTYNDKNLSLKNIALTQFEMSREIPAAIDLFAKQPHTLDMQTRMLILRVNAAMHNLKIKKQNNTRYRGWTFYHFQTL